MIWYIQFHSYEIRCQTKTVGCRWRTLPYWKSSVDGQISAYCQCTFKMGQSVTHKSQSLLHILYILDTLGHFMDIIRII